jgi:hypothetical protein
MLGLGLGLQFTQGKKSGSEGSDYITTTTAEGYSGGSASCADATFSALQAIPSDFLLQEEGGGFILQENGFKIIT